MYTQRYSLLCIHGDYAPRVSLGMPGETGVVGIFVDENGLGLAFEDTVVDDNLAHSLHRRKFIHDFEYLVFHLGPLAAGTCLALHGLFGYRAQGLVAVFLVHIFDLE